MSTSTSNRPRTWQEGRRVRAWELHQQGRKRPDLAAALGVPPGAVSQWLKRAGEEGIEALRRPPAPGRRPRLSAEQRAQVPTVLAKGAEAFGFRGDVWTTARVATVIEGVFGVRYHPAHVSRLLRAIAWSVQKPIRRATQRDEAAIAAWYTERWPAIKRGPRKKAATSSGETRR